MGPKWNTASSAVGWVEEYVLVGSVASLLAHQLDDTNHHGSHESSTDKLGDLCTCSRGSELKGIVMSPPLSEFAAVGRSEHFPQQSLRYSSPCFFVCPSPLRLLRSQSVTGGFK